MGAKPASAKLGIALLILAIGAAGLIIRARHAAEDSDDNEFAWIPKQIRQPGVIRGAGVLSESLFLLDLRVGDVRDIRAGTFDRSRGPEIGIVGTRGAAFVDGGGTVIALTKFEPTRSDPRIIDVQNDGDCEFLERGDYASPAILLDHNGKKIWQFGSHACADAAPGDINGDGKLEFVIVGFQGSDDDISLLGAIGKESWRVPESGVSFVEMIDTNGDGRLEIVHSNAGAQIVVRNERGGVLWESKSGDLYTEFSVCHYPSSTSRAYCLHAGDGSVSVIGYSGRTVARFAAPNACAQAEVYGTPVKLQEGKPDYLAIIITYRSEDVSVLYVFDSGKKAIYEESLPDAYRAIAPATLGKGRTESLLIGTEHGRVLRYDFVEKDQRHKRSS